MILFRYFRVLLWFATLGIAETSRAQDGVEDVLRRGYEIPLRWDNIERSPEWVGGNPPRRSGIRGNHEVFLEPGECTCVRIPGYEWLRIVSGQGDIVPTDIEVFLSNGSGLLASIDPATGTNCKSLFFAPRSPVPLLAYVSRPTAANGVIRLGLFCSRHDPLQPIASYRGQVDFGPERKARIGTSRDRDLLEFWRWELGDGVRLKLRGPGRFKLESRFHYPARDTSISQNYSITVSELNSAKIAGVEFSTSPESSYLVFADGVAQVVSRLETGYFELPENRDYLVGLETTAPVFVRMLKMQENDYLVPTLNSPNLFSSRTRDLFQGSPWEIPENLIAQTLANPEAETAEFIGRTAMRLVRDNGRSEGSTMAAALLWNAGWQRPDYPEMRSRWREFSAFTYYRNLLPDTACAAVLSEAYFPVRSLYPVGKRQESLVLGKSHLASTYSRLPEAIFCPIRKSDATVYLLPDRSAATQVRVVARRDRNKPVDFSVSMPGESTRRFRLLPGFDAPQGETQPSASESALLFVKGGTLDTAASFLGPNAETVSAGFFEFTIPPEVGRMEIRNGEGSENLPVALQVRSSKPFQMGEDEYAAMAMRAGSREILYQWLVECIAQENAATPGESRIKREMFNHCEPLRQFVQSRYRQFADSVRPTTTGVEELGRLDDEGENFLAEHLARSLYLYSNEAPVRDRAFVYLENLALRRIDDDESMILNHCVKLVREPNHETALRLANRLREDGKPDLALLLALVIPKDEASRELRLASTFLNGWWAHFGAILAEAPGDPACRIWRGIRLWQQGFQDQAREEWNSAGRPGEAWLSYAEATAQAREKVVKGESAGLRDWAFTEIHTPGLPVWKSVSPGKITAFQSAATIKVRETGEYMQTFVATPIQPVEMNFPGPGMIQIEVRPIHPANSISTREGWIEISTSGNDPVRVPVLNNYPSEGLDIVGRDREKAGTKLTETLALVGWNNRVQIRPDFGPVLVRVKSRVPEVRSGCLPEFTEETAGRLFGSGNPLVSRAAQQIDSGEVALVDRDHTVTWHRLGSPFSAPLDSEIKKVHEAFRKLTPLPISLPNSETREVVRKMRLWLGDSQTGNAAEVRAAIASAAAEGRLWKSVPEVDPIQSAILRRTVWEPLLAIDQNAGFREIETPGWEPETPSLLTRMRFLPKLGIREQLIAGTDRSVALLTNRETNQIRLRLSLDTIPFLIGKPLVATITVEGSSPAIVRLGEEKSDETFNFDVPQGRTSVRLEVADTDPNQYLRVEFDSDKDRESLERSTSRNWFVAYKNEPLSARIDGPAWVRIDRLFEKGVQSEYRLVKEETGDLTLFPDSGSGKEGLYRIFVLRQDPDKHYEPPSYTKRTVREMPAPLASQAIEPPATRVKYQDGFSLHGQEDGTWTAGLSYNRRRIGDEDNSTGIEPYRQGDLTYRYFDEDRRTYYRTTLLGRDRNSGNATLGLEHSQQYNPFDSPFTYSFSGSLFEQGGEWSLSGRGSISASSDLSAKWKHISSASIFGRVISLGDASESPEKIDRDVFSQYKSDHGIGLNVSETLVYTPWEDTRIFAGVGLTTNENFISPDSVNYRIGADQMLGPVRIGVDLTGYRFFDDDDRSGSVSRHQLNLEASAEFWTREQHRFEAGVRWSHYIEEDDNAISIFCRWNFGEGRLFRDFRPDEKPFSDIRERRIPHDRNNSVQSIHE